MRMGRVWASWNVRGLGSSTKREATKKVFKKIKPEVCFLQESKLDENRMKLLVSWAKSLGMEFDYVPAVGVAGGLVSLWRKSALKVVQTKKNQRYLLLFVQFRNSSGIDVVGNVYGPNNVGDRVAFFNSLGADLRMATGSIILGGDFNAILNDGERSGSEEANSVGDASFKSFVEEFELTDLPLWNGDSTWGSTRGGGLWSKLDRWLLNSEAIFRLDGACQSMED